MAWFLLILAGMCEVVWVVFRPNERWIHPPPANQLDRGGYDS